MTTRTESARALAAEALLRIDDGAFAHILVPELLRKHDLEARDRAFVTELVYGTVRMRRGADHLPGPPGSLPLASLGAAVRVSRRLRALLTISRQSPGCTPGGLRS